jgi:hypothetical protein
VRKNHSEWHLAKGFVSWAPPRPAKRCRRRSSRQPHQSRCRAHIVNVINTRIKTRFPQWMQVKDAIPSIPTQVATSFAVSTAMLSCKYPAPRTDRQEREPLYLLPAHLSRHRPHVVWPPLLFVISVTPVPQRHTSVIDVSVRHTPQSRLTRTCVSVHNPKAVPSDQCTRTQPQSRFDPTAAGPTHLHHH